MGRAKRKRVFGYMQTAKAQINLYIRTVWSGDCPLAESLDTTKCMNGEQRPGLYLTHAQDDANGWKTLDPNDMCIDKFCQLECIFKGVPMKRAVDR